MAKIIELTGKRFGRLAVIKRCPTKDGAHWKWLCKCDCGTEKIVSGHALRNGNTSSCGCLRRDRAIAANTKHGGRHDPAYNCWALAKRRCHSANNPKYPSYGGRGIFMCEEWRDDFGAFIRDMGPRPSTSHSIERIDNDGPYAPHNCRWATPFEQSRNKTSNILITHNGTTKIAADWDRVLGFADGTIKQRVRKGWTSEEVITAPKGFRKGRGWR